MKFLICKFNHYFFNYCKIMYERCLAIPTIHCRQNQHSISSDRRQYGNPNSQAQYLQTSSAFISFVQYHLLVYHLSLPPPIILPGFQVRMITDKNCSDFYICVHCPIATTRFIHLQRHSKKAGIVHKTASLKI